MAKLRRVKILVIERSEDGKEKIVAMRTAFEHNAEAVAVEFEKRYRGHFNIDDDGDYIVWKSVGDAAQMEMPGYSKEAVQEEGKESPLGRHRRAVAARPPDGK